MIQQTTIGIIGGGQLAKMVSQSAKQIGFHVRILDPTPNSPAGQVSDEQVIGDLYDPQALKEFIAGNDVTTYDIEHIDTATLKLIAEQQSAIYPAPRILELIQDKFLQKQMLIAAGIPTSKFAKVEDYNDLQKTIETQGFTYPIVQKACKGGYDGKGVQILNSAEDLPKALKTESFIEEFVDLDKELAVNITRGLSGEITLHPVVEMVFDPELNLCDLVIAPAQIGEHHAAESLKIGEKVLQALGEGAIGIFAIELFLTKDGKILVNEIAPRPHNSAHYSIEACITSQFEQHIRAITGLPLGSTTLLSPAVMVNILGPKDYEGPVTIEKITELLSIPGLSLHLYGKSLSKPGRKIGHCTILDSDVNEAVKKAEIAKKLLA